MDRDGRLWMPRYVLPTDQAKRWTVWNGEHEEFSVEVPINERLLDVLGDLVLLRGPRRTGR